MIKDAFKADILTLDNFLHVVLGIPVIALAIISPPTAATAALYLREQGQARSWTLKWSFHKHAEWVIPGIALHVLYYIWQAT